MIILKYQSDSVSYKIWKKQNDIAKLIATSIITVSLFIIFIGQHRCFLYNVWIWSGWNSDIQTNFVVWGLF